MSYLFIYFLNNCILIIFFKRTFFFNKIPKSGVFFTESIYEREILKYKKLFLFLIKFIFQIKIIINKLLFIYLF